MNIAKISISVLLLLSFFFVSGQVSWGIRTIAVTTVKKQAAGSLLARTPNKGNKGKKHETPL